jgi:hypothetical protein
MMPVDCASRQALAMRTNIRVARVRLADFMTSPELL